MFSFCHIDYSKNSDISFTTNSLGVSIKKEFANIHFSIDADNNSMVLEEDSDFVLLMVASPKQQKNQVKYLLEKFKSIDIGEILNSFDDAYSLIVFDKKNDKLYFSIDHFGLIPAYYYQSIDNILISNSLKKFKEYSFFEKKINSEVLGQYLQHGYIQKPHTIFKNCYKVKSAHYAIFDLKSKKIEQKKYWDLADFYKKQKLDLDEDEILQKCHNLIKTSIYNKIDSSKEIGAFLSGGYDSSLINAILSKHPDIM